MCFDLLIWVFWGELRVLGCVGFCGYELGFVVCGWICDGLMVDWLCLFLV